MQMRGKMGAVPVTPPRSGFDRLNKEIDTHPGIWGVKVCAQESAHRRQMAALPSIVEVHAPGSLSKPISSRLNMLLQRGEGAQNTGTWVPDGRPSVHAG